MLGFQKIGNLLMNLVTTGWWIYMMVAASGIFLNAIT